MSVGFYLTHLSHHWRKKGSTGNEIIHCNQGFDEGRRGNPPTQPVGERRNTCRSYHFHQEAHCKWWMYVCACLCVGACLPMLVNSCILLKLFSQICFTLYFGIISDYLLSLYSPVHLKLYSIIYVFTDCCKVCCCCNTFISLLWDKQKMFLFSSLKREKNESLHALTRHLVIITCDPY